MSHDEPDQRERLALERALRELGHNPADYGVEIATAPPRPTTNSFHAMPRKTIVVTGANGAKYRLETYAHSAWAGEVLLAIVEGKLE